MAGAGLEGTQVLGVGTEPPVRPRLLERRYHGATSHQDLHTLALGTSGEQNLFASDGECSKACEELISHHSQCTNTGEQTYSCTECGKVFRKNNKLKRHLFIHMDELPHPCTECKRPFKSKSELQRHMRVHTGRRPYPCKECAQAFRTNDGLKQHMRAHTRKCPSAQNVRRHSNWESV